MGHVDCSCSRWNAQGFLDTLEPLKIVGLKLPPEHVNKFETPAFGI